MDSTTSIWKLNTFTEDENPGAAPLNENWEKIADAVDSINTQIANLVNGMPSKADLTSALASLASAVASVSAVDTRESDHYLSLNKGKAKNEGSVAADGTHPAGDVVRYAQEIIATIGDPGTEERITGEQVYAAVQTATSGISKMVKKETFMVSTDSEQPGYTPRSAWTYYNNGKLMKWLPCENVILEDNIDVNGDPTGTAWKTSSPVLNASWS